MKIPEPLFKIINPTIGLLLRSPAHFLMSGSLLLITFTGVRTGRSYSTPLRYLRDGETIRCFTSKDTRWWRNLRKGARVWLTLQGVGAPYQASIIVDEPGRVRQLLTDYLRQHPGDAAYHDVAVSKNGDLSDHDLDRAVSQAVVMEARPA
ncbi:MAG: nitroreductase/quinone reductase family protein [Gammaproteobacteria bacterium]|nr:nitroreductase/quinone reductase family protein [Gammaproteobacteria bacterium]